MKKFLILLAAGTAFAFASCSSTPACCGSCSSGECDAASKCEVGCKCAKCTAAKQ